MRVLVTGGSGFMGTNLLQHYLDAGMTVLNVDKRPPRQEAHRHVWHEADCMSLRELGGVFSEFEPTHVVHLAARTDLRGRAVSDYAVNYLGTRGVIQAARQSAPLRRIVFASTRLVCRIGYLPRADDDYQATTPYGESKIMAERAIRAARLDVPWVIVRPTSIWGPWFELPYRAFFDAVRRGSYVHPRGRQIKKSFGYVGNSVHQIDGVLRCDPELVNERTLYLADDPPIEVFDMARRISREFDAPSVRTLPVAVLRALARVGDGARKAGWSEPPLTSFRLNNLLTEMIFDLSPLNHVAGPPPYDLTAGIQATVSWIRSTNDKGATKQG